MLTRCAGTCDKDINRCLCGEGARFPRRPMVHCLYNGVEHDMPWQTPGWANFARAPRTAFWTAGGGAAASRVRGASVAWCDADPDLLQRPMIQCKCYTGQSAARFCEPISPRGTESAFCLNQCSGRGECHTGYCHCKWGYHGADCSIRTVDGQRANNGTTSATGSYGVPRSATPIPAATTPAATTPTATTPAATPTEALTTSTGASAASSSASEAHAIPRPRVFVYELPGEFNTFLVARRQAGESCVTREYVLRGGQPTVQWSGNLYGAEVALHEALLSSTHRVMDPEMADFFYVPAYGGCYISEFNRASPTHWLCDRCHKGVAADLATLRAMRWHEALRLHISTACSRASRTLWRISRYAAPRPARHWCAGELKVCIPLALMDPACYTLIAGLSLLEPLRRGGSLVALHTRRGCLLCASLGRSRHSPCSLGTHACSTQWLFGVPSMARPPTCAPDVGTTRTERLRVSSPAMLDANLPPPCRCGVAHSRTVPSTRSETAAATGWQVWLAPVLRRLQGHRDAVVAAARGICVLAIHVTVHLDVVCRDTRS